MNFKRLITRRRRAARSAANITAHGTIRDGTCATVYRATRGATRLVNIGHQVTWTVHGVPGADWPTDKADGAPVT